MWYILFIFLAFLIAGIILSEIGLFKTKDYIRYSPPFGCLLYFGSLFTWITALLTYVLSNQTFWLGIAIFIPISFVFFLFAIVLFFTCYKIQKHSIRKRILFCKKEYRYEDFALTYAPGRIVATSATTGKEYFSFTSFHTNVDVFLEAYSNSVQTKKINLDGKIVRANKTVASFGLWIGVLGLFTLAMAIISLIPDLFGQPTPIAVQIMIWVLVFPILGAASYCWLYYAFHYLEIENGNIIIHKPFCFKKAYDHRKLYIEDKYYMMKLKDESNRTVFVLFFNFSENALVLYKYLKRRDSK